MFKGVQNDILTSNSKTILVSAGAGSGKTTVMINKIANMLLSGDVDIDNLLVVTFTVLAADEMKQRLIKRLKTEALEKPDIAEHVLEIAEKIKTASIDTIDGFASKTIKKYFYDLEISPNVNIISDATKDYYLTRAMKKTMDDFSIKSEDVLLLLDIFGGNSRNLKPIEKTILDVYNNIISLENPELFLDEVCSKYVNTITSEKVVNAKICNLAKFVLIKIADVYSMLNAGVQQKLSVLVSELNNFNVNLSFKHNLSCLESLTVVKFSSSEIKENAELKDVIVDINKIFKLKKDLEENEINLNFEENSLKCVEYLSIFVDLVKNFIKNYNNIKAKNNFIDFNDLNRLMLKLLNNDKIKLELQLKYTNIFIDEYQDVNPLQNSIVNLLVGEHTNLFMVGDVKQSIYAFRGATPEGFLNKYNSIAKKEIEGEKFDMNLNFRSNPKILEFINELFSKIMTEELTGINYKRDCLIEPQRDDIVDDKVRIALFAPETNEEKAHGLYSVKQDQGSDLKYSSEVNYIVDNITKLINTEFYDANTKEIRKVKYGDIAILCRSEKDEKAKMLISLLKEKAIPVSVCDKIEPQSSECVKLVISILKCVIGLADDVDYLASMLALTNLTIDEIIELRDFNFSLKQNFIDSNNENIKQGLHILNKIKIASYTKTNTQLIRFILNECKLKYYILRHENGLKEFKILKEFLNTISTVEDSLNLAEFIDVVESNVSKGGDFNSKDGENCVTIQTIHKSKGLEYPIVFLYGSGRSFSSDTDLINFNADLGLGVDCFNKEQRTKKPSMIKFAIADSNKQKNYREEMRLLYVALTRAKNKLFITGYYTKKALIDKDFENNSYINMILDCFIDRIVSTKTELKNCEIEVFDGYEIASDILKSNNNLVEARGLNFEYENSFKFKIPLKNSVTSINSKAAQNSGFSVKNWLSKKVQYNADEDKAMQGIHYHKALELLDLKSDYYKYTDFTDVDYNLIEKAHKTLSELTKNAINIQKEAEFMMYVPYNSVVESEVDDKVLIQGVVDLLIENPSSVTLVDYKFSTLSSEILKEKYMEQLKLYKMAIENAYNKPVDHMYIYSVNNSKLIEI